MEKKPHNPLEGNAPELTIKLHNSPEENISIIIIHKDKPEYLNILLQSLAVTTFNTNYEIIVVDNNSGSETQSFLDDIKHKVKVVKNDKNLQWSAACNKGASIADKSSKYLVFMHHDLVILDPSWLDLMCSASYNQNSGFVGMGSQTYELGDKSIEFVSEHCLLMTRECWNDIGPWPEKLPIIGHAFIMNMRARDKGYKPQYMRQTNLVHHYKNFSFGYDVYLKAIDEAQVEIPKMLTDMQTKKI